MKKIEMKELKDLVPKDKRINIVDFVAPSAKNKINYFSNIIYGRKKLNQNQKEEIYKYCVENLNYNGDIHDLFVYTKKIEKEKSTKYYNDFAIKIRMCIEKEKYFNNRTFEKIIKDSEYQDYSVSRSTLINYKNGNTQPAINEIENLAICLNVVPQFLKGTYLLPIDYMYKDQVQISENWSKEQEKNKNIFLELKGIITNIHNNHIPQWRDDALFDCEYPEVIYDGMDEYLENEHLNNVKSDFDTQKEYEDYMDDLAFNFMNEKENEYIQNKLKELNSIRFEDLFSDNDFYNKLTDFIYSFEKEYFKKAGLKAPTAICEDIYRNLELYQGAVISVQSQARNNNYYIHSNKIHIWAIENKYIDYGDELNKKIIHSCRDSIKFYKRHSYNNK